MSFLGHLDTTCSIERATPYAYGWGENILAWASTTASVQCALQPVRPSSIMRDFGYQLEADYEAYFPAGTDLRPSDSSTSGARDRIKIGSTYYTILGVFNMAGKGKGLRVYLRRQA